MKKKTKQIFLMLCMFFFTAFAVAQQRTVKGKVIDQNGTPLPNVSYVIKGTQAGGMTDENGDFTVQISGNDAILIFSEVNHQPEEVRVGNQTELTVMMSAKNANLQEIVVTALGIKREQRKLGYATTTLNSDDISKTVPTNFASALYGKAPGVTITSNPEVHQALYPYKFLVFRPLPGRHSLCWLWMVSSSETEMPIMKAIGEATSELTEMAYWTSIRKY